MKPLALLLAALCGAIIAIGLTPRAVPDSGDAPEMADNVSEISSMRNSIESLRELVEERNLRIKRMVEILTPAERMN